MISAIQPSEKLAEIEHLERLPNCRPQCDNPGDCISALSQMIRSKKGFILFSGENGTGKTYAAKCVYNAILYPTIHPNRDLEKAFFSTQAALNITLEHERTKFGQIQTFLNSISTSQLVVLDDIGTRVPSEALMDFIYALVDYRSSENLATIITTNKNCEDLRLICGDAFISRVASARTFRFKGKDRRIKKF